MEKYKKLYKNNKFNISTSTWNKKFKLPDGSYSVSDIEDYLSIASKYQKIGLFKIKAGYYLELLLLKQWNYLAALKVR